MTSTDIGLIILGVGVILAAVVSILTLMASRKYSKTRISLSLEVERDPIKGEADGSSINRYDNDEGPEGR